MVGWIVQGVKEMNKQLIYMGMNIYVAKVNKKSVSGHEYVDYEIINKELIS
jgi:hypothetical protein